MSLTVLHAIPSFAGGGAELQLINLTKAQLEKNIKVHIIYLHEGPNFDEIKESGATLHKLNGFSSKNPFVIFQIIKLIQQIKPSIIQTWLLYADVFVGIAAKISGVPWVLSERSGKKNYEKKFKFILRKFIGSFADAIVSNSKGGLDYWRGSVCVKHQKIIKNIVIAKHPNLSRGSCKDITSEILAVGRFSKEKNFDLLLDALEFLCKFHPNIHATIIGDGPLYPVLKERVFNSIILKEHVELPGYIDDVSKYLDDSPVYVSLSACEGMPNSVIEAALSRCPMVLSDITAHRELFNEDEVIFLLDNSYSTIAEAILYQLDSYAKSSESLKSAILRLVEYSPERISGEYSNLYQNLLGKCGKCE
jgi:glycosyltransferase involved in cell wall biosynthesis